MKAIQIQITSKSLAKSYTINLDDEFAKSFEKDLKLLTKNGDYIDAKDLLEAYIQKSYENFLQVKKIDSLMNGSKE